MKRALKSLFVVFAAVVLLAGCHNKPTKTNDENEKPNSSVSNNTNNNNPATVQTTEWSGSIDANTTWPDLGLDVDYVIDGWVEITGNALLTIEPGVTIMFTGVDGGIGVGENAGLKMVGTADKPIIVEGPQNNQNNGSWNGIRIDSKRSDNQIEYVQFLRGGSDDGDWGGVVHLTNGRLSMKNCLIDGSLGQGVDCEYEGYFTAFENNTVKNCEKYPMVCEYLPATCKNIGTGNTFVNNGNNVVKCFNVGELEENLTLHELPIPYSFNGGFGLFGNKTMTIEAGVEITLPIGEGISIGDECQFKAEGTAEKPIIFRCEEPSEAWIGIDFASHRNGNVMSYCQIKNCGTEDGWRERGCLYIRSEAKLTLTNNVFGPSGYNGVSIENIENWGKVTHSDNSFVDCAGGNVWLDNGGEYNGNTYESGQTLNDLP